MLWIFSVFLFAKQKKRVSQGIVCGPGGAFYSYIWYVYFQSVTKLWKRAKCKLDPFWWLVRVTLVVAFGFLPKNFGRWWGPMSSIFYFHNYRFSGGNTMMWWWHSNHTLCIRICLNVLHSQVAETKNFQALALVPSLASEPPSGIFTT